MKTDQQHRWSSPSSLSTVVMSHNLTRSVTRLAEQGFNITWSKHRSLTNNNSFEAAFKKKDGLHFLPVKSKDNNPKNKETWFSPDIRRHQGSNLTNDAHNDRIWMYNNQDYLVRPRRR